MTIYKILLVRGSFEGDGATYLVSFDKNDKPLDIINLSETMVGSTHVATVEKVMADIDASILKLEDGNKAFIENKRLEPDSFIVRHSKNKKVCQQDQFYVVISQDAKQNKPASCHFLRKEGLVNSQLDYIIDIITASSPTADLQLIMDKDLELETKYQYRRYQDQAISLWDLYGLSGLFNKVKNKNIYLSNGSNIVIDETKALTVIDVNSAGNYGKGDSLSINKAAAEALIQNLRLRSISGIIVIDFLKMPKSKEAELFSYVKELIRQDYAHIRLYDFTRLGLLEITRDRTFKPISEIFQKISTI